MGDPTPLLSAARLSMESMASCDVGGCGHVQAMQQVRGWGGAVGVVRSRASHAVGECDDWRWRGMVVSSTTPCKKTSQYNTVAAFALRSRYNHHA